MYIIAIFRVVVEKKKDEPKVEVVDDDTDDDIDLDDLDVTTKKMQLSKEASNGRTNLEII